MLGMGFVWKYSYSVLIIPWQPIERDTMRLPLLQGGIALKLKQADGVLGGTVWPAAGVLCQHLLNHTAVFTAEKENGRTTSILEMGSGTGAVGLFAAANGAFVTLTEHKPPVVAIRPMVAYSVDGIPEVEPDATSDRLLRLLQENVNANLQHFRHPPTVAELDWTHPEHAKRLATSVPPFDLILASDVTYDSQLHNALAFTIAQFLSPSSTCLVAHEKRVLSLRGNDSQLESFQSVLADHELTVVDQVRRTIQDEKGRHEVTILDIQQYKRNDKKGIVLDSLKH